MRGRATAFVGAVTVAAGAVVSLGVADAGRGHRPHVAKNVIILQGDGMSTAQRDFIRLINVGPERELAMNSLEHTGLLHTTPDDPTQIVTDSAAAATAYSTGVKSFNGAIGVDASGARRETLLEAARDAGKATGLVTTSQVTDASPAAFGSHVQDRDLQSEIARQFIEDTKVDLILGGGEDRWLPPGEEGAWPDHPATDPEEESSGDAGNLISRAQDLGYTYVSSRDELASARVRLRRGEKLLGLFANEEMFEHREEGDGDLYDPSVPLTEMATKALDVLSRDRDGFFLFVEEEGIDEMAHENNAPLMAKAGAALDATVQVAVDFARTHPDTLIVVEGDHETGGLTIENVDAEDESGEEISREDGPFPVAGTDLQVVADWTTNQHTGADIPVTASGPGSEHLDGIFENTELHDVVLKAMRLG